MAVDEFGLLESETGVRKTWVPLKRNPGYPLP
jgi:hypothetical protein